MEPSGGDMSNVEMVVKARLFFADGRVIEDQILPLTPAATRYRILENRCVHWFSDTRNVDADGFLELRETADASL